MEVIKACRKRENMQKLMVHPRTLGLLTLHRKMKSRHFDGTLASRQG